MSTTSSRWHVPGSIGVNTVFDEATELATPSSLAWASIGSAIAHNDVHTLNLLETSEPRVDRGPTLNFWASNPAGSGPSRVLRLASVGVRFSSVGQDVAGSYLKLSTKPANGDVREALRITAEQDVGIGTPIPAARLSIVARGATEIGGTQPSTTLRTSSGSLGANVNDELRLASFGFHSRNQTSLGIHARRTLAGNDWTTTEIGLLINVDNTAAAGNSGLWLSARGGATINGVTVGAPARGFDYPYQNETIGVADRTSNLRLQSPNSVLVHTRDGERAVFDSWGLRVNGRMSWAGVSELTGGGSIELGGGTPYVDFHHGSAPASLDFSARIINDLPDQITLQAPRVRALGTLVIEGLLNDASARDMLRSMPPYSVLMSVEELRQGTALVWYWKDGRGGLHKAWDGGTNGF